MHSFLIVFSFIVFANSKPNDSNEQQYDNISTSVSGEIDENSSLYANSPSGVLTKYPDDPFDSYSKPIIYTLLPQDTRFRRETDSNATDTSIDVLMDQIEDVKRPERKTDDQHKVPLRSFISGIESDLVSKALQVNSLLNQRRRRSIKKIDKNGGEDADEDNEENMNYRSNNRTFQSDSLDDVNKNFFEGLFNYTRPVRTNEDKKLKIPLNNFVQAVETTLVNSAQNLKESKPSKRYISNYTEDIFKSDANDAKQTDRIDRTQQTKIIDNEPGAQQPEIKVAKIASTSSADLNLLGPIAFKPLNAELTQSEEETFSTTQIPIQKTNLSVIKGSHSLSLIPDDDKNLAHIQHQEISHTVFSSNLAIFPTISPQSINAPLPTHITTEEPDQTTITQKMKMNARTDEDLKREQLMQKVQQLKEKFAEIQAEPVIFTQI